MVASQEMWYWLIMVAGTGNGGGPEDVANAGNAARYQMTMKNSVGNISNSGGYVLTCMS